MGGGQKEGNRQKEREKERKKSYYSGTVLHLCACVTWKQALGQGLRGSVEPILLTTLRVAP